MNKYFSIWLLLTQIISLYLEAKVNPNPLLLLISFDGFRWDYLLKHNLSAFESLKKNGSYADYIYSSFITRTFPNHWTMVTGMYEETHGIVDNDMYDPVLDKEFHRNPSSYTREWFGQNPYTEPIWTTNQKNGHGRRSLASWVGDAVSFSGQDVPSIPFDQSRSFYDLADSFIRMFTDDLRPINFGAMYIFEPGHLYGPDSAEMEIKLQQLNLFLEYLISELKRKELYDQMNLIITSDHGMENIKRDGNIVLSTYIDTSLFNAYGSAAGKNIFLKKKSNLNYVYGTLQTIKFIDTYKKEEIPEELHYKANVRVGDILIVAKPGYEIYLSRKEMLEKKQKGDHGYYNIESSMWPIFIANGPAFKRNGFKSQPFSNVDIYPLMCNVLEVKPAMNNGSLDIVKYMLAV